MPEVKKNAISFKSSNGTDIVAGYYYTCPGMEPRCILQISHGMCEYIGRYDDFAGYMAQKGYVVCGNDHLGHGATSSGPNGTRSSKGTISGANVRSKNGAPTEILSADSASITRG